MRKASAGFQGLVLRGVRFGIGGRESFNRRDR
jgi:hypothetical protein